MKSSSKVTVTPRASYLSKLLYEERVVAGSRARANSFDLGIAAEEKQFQGGVHHNLNVGHDGAESEWRDIREEGEGHMLCIYLR